MTAAKSTIYPTVEAAVRNAAETRSGYGPLIAA
jgi:hypothetical protein